MEFYPSQVRFIGEQKGKTEQEFKLRLSILLKQFEEPVAAYLCRVAYLGGDSSGAFNVALCLASQTKSKDEMRLGTSAIFSQMFGVHEHLDIIFVGEEQEVVLSKVCRPFLVIN